MPFQNGSIEKYIESRSKLFRSAGWETIFLSKKELNNEVDVVNKLIRSDIIDRIHNNKQ